MFQSRASSLSPWAFNFPHPLCLQPGETLLKKKEKNTFTATRLPADLKERLFLSTCFLSICLLICECGRQTGSSPKMSFLERVRVASFLFLRLEWAESLAIALAILFTGKRATTGTARIQRAFASFLRGFTSASKPANRGVETSALCPVVFPSHRRCRRTLKRGPHTASHSPSCCIYTCTHVHVHTYTERERHVRAHLLPV